MPAKDGDKYVLQVGKGPANITVECAVSPSALTQGLSGRDRMPNNHGMLFVFPRLEWHSMWMKGMRFPLDIVWLDETMTVVSVIKNAYPCAADGSGPCPSFSSSLMTQYAIELNAGMANTFGIRNGTTFTVI